MSLIKQYPELPIVPMVSGEIAADDDGYWMGEWGKAYVDEFITTGTAQRIFFKGDEDMWDVLEHYLPAREFDLLPQDEKECFQIYERLPWKKAIIVAINEVS